MFFITGHKYRHIENDTNLDKNSVHLPDKHYSSAKQTNSGESKVQDATKVCVTWSFTQLSTIYYLLHIKHYEHDEKNALYLDPEGL